MGNESAKERKDDPRSLARESSQKSNSEPVDHSPPLSPISPESDTSSAPLPGCHVTDPDGSASGSVDAGTVESKRPADDDDPRLLEAAVASEAGNNACSNCRDDDFSADAVAVNPEGEGSESLGCDMGKELEDATDRDAAPMADFARDQSNMTSQNTEISKDSSDSADNSTKAGAVHETEVLCDPESGGLPRDAASPETQDKDHWEDGVASSCYPESHDSLDVCSEVEPHTDRSNTEGEDVVERVDSESNVSGKESMKLDREECPVMTSYENGDEAFTVDSNRQSTDFILNQMDGDCDSFGAESDAESGNVEFSLSDIDDVVGDIDQSEVLDQTESVREVTDSTCEGSSDKPSQSQLASQIRASQSPVAADVQIDQSGVVSEETELERGLSDGSDGERCEADDTADSATLEAHQSPHSDLTTEPGNLSLDPHPEWAQSWVIPKEDKDSRDFTSASLDTPDNEDRIDKVCALLNKYKASKAARDAATGGRHSEGKTTTHGEEKAWRVIESAEMINKSDRSWMADENNSDFPVHDFVQLNDEAEHRIAARRAARQEAREIRMREIERQQREAEEKEGKIVNKSTTSRPLLSSHYGTSRQDSDDTEDIRTLKKDLQEMDERYTKAMMDNAQLDNEKQVLRYEVDLLKDRLDDLSEEHLELQRQHKDKCRECEHKKRENTDLTEEVAFLKQQLQQRDKLIEEYGLVFISNDTLAKEEDKDHCRQTSSEPGITALVTPQAAEILKKHGEGSLDERLKQFDQQNKELHEEIKKLKQLLDEEKERCALAEKYSTPVRVSQVSNGPDISELQMETQRMLNDYKFKLKKAQQDITTLEGNVIRLESQAKRYKQAAENSERNEEELKSEKRKLQRELREAQSQIEELQTSNQHLQKRMEKMKSARNAILKS